MNEINSFLVVWTELTKPSWRLLSLPRQKLFLTEHVSITPGEAKPFKKIQNNDHFQL